MNTTIRLRIKKQIDAPTEKKVLKLKGSLIAQSFTDIIHYDDDGEDYYINHFTTVRKQEAQSYISSFLADQSMGDFVVLLDR